MNAHTRQGIPLRPDRRAQGESVINTFVRSVIASAAHVLDKQTPPSQYAKRWGTDEAKSVEYVLRAATGPATTYTTGWAEPLSHVTAIFLPALFPLSAGVALLDQGLKLSFDGMRGITLPTITPGVAKFIQEGAPIPVQQFNTDPGPMLEPAKLGVISVLTREMIESTNAETLVRQVLSESVAAGVDAVLFSTLPAAPEHPAGLLEGVAALTASTDTDKITAMISDLSVLAGAVARVAGTGGITFIAAPEQALSIGLRFPKDFTEYQVLATAALPPGTVIAVATAAIASAFSGVPQIEATRQAALVMNDVPSDGAPVASMFQTDNIAIKCRLRCNWTLRASGAVAWLQGVTW